METIEAQVTPTKPVKVYKNTVKPPTEVALFTLQEEYLRTRDPALWTEMFGIMYTYARSLVLKKIKGKIFLEEDIVSDAAAGAALKFMQRYHYDESFMIQDSFAGVLKWKVIEALYGDYEEDDHVSLNMAIGENAQGELGDTQVRNGFEHISLDDDVYNPERQLLAVNTEEELSRILQELDTETQYDSHMAILVRMYVLLHLRRPKSRHAKLLFKKHFCSSYKEEEILDLTIMELRNRLRGL